MISIQKKISYIFVLLGVLMLLLSSGFQYLSYQSRLKSQIDELILEEVALIINKLDHYRVIDQNNFIARTIYQLENVQGVVLFDKDCNVLMANPLNTPIRKSCGRQNNDLLLFDNKNIFSSSNGAVKYVYIKPLPVGQNWQTSTFLVSIILPALLILILLGVLRAVLKYQIYRPLSNFGQLTASTLVLPAQENIENEYPTEFKPIISGIKNREKRVLEVQKKLIKQAGLQAQVKLGRQVAHDIQSPVGALKAASLAIKSTPEKAVTLILNATNRIQSITDDLKRNHLNEAHTTAVQASFDVVDALEDIIQEKQYEYRDLEIKITLEIKTNRTQLVGDPQIMSRVFSNLINNSAEACTNEAKIAITLTDCHSHLLLEFRDNGPGIPARVIENLGSYGNTTKEAGFGSGLAHAKEILESFDGRIEVSSSEGAIIRLFMKPDTKQLGAEP